MTAQDHHQDRMRAGALLAGAAVSAVWAVSAGNAFLAILACGMLFAALFTFKQTVEPRPYAHWPALLAGAASLLMLTAVSGEAARYLALPLAAVETVVGVVLAVLWARRRDGSGDWIVWHPEGRILLRREWSRRAALRWALREYRQACLIDQLDLLPELRTETPLYPYRDRPHVTARGVAAQQ